MTDLATPTLAGAARTDEDDVAESGRAESKGERTKRRLLELAIERFGAQGFRATSVSEIARKAGLTQAAAYTYFSNKDALFAAAVNEDASALIDDACTEARDVPVDLYVPTLILCLLGGLDHHPLARRVLAGQEPEAIVHLVGLPALDRFTGSMELRLVGAQAAGEVRSDIEPAVIAAGIQSMVVALLMSTIQTGGAATPRAQMGVVAAFEAMLRAPAPPA